MIVSLLRLQLNITFHAYCLIHSINVYWSACSRQWAQHKSYRDVWCGSCLGGPCSLMRKTKKQKTELTAWRSQGTFLGKRWCWSDHVCVWRGAVVVKAQWVSYHEGFCTLCCEVIIIGHVSGGNYFFTFAL